MADALYRAQTSDENIIFSLSRHQRLMCRLNEQQVYGSRHDFNTRLRQTYSWRRLVSGYLKQL